MRAIGSHGLDAPHAHIGCLDQPVAVIVKAARRDHDRQPRPVVMGEPEVDGLTVHQVCTRDCARTPVPRGIRHDPHVAGLDREQQCGLVAEAVGAPLEAVPTAEPAVAEQHLDAVGARAQEVGDVVREHLQAFAVRREARNELIIADARSVDEHLDQTVGRDGQGRRARHVDECEVPGEVVCRPVAGIRDGALMRSNPRRCGNGFHTHEGSFARRNAPERTLIATKLGVALTKLVTRNHASLSRCCGPPGVPGDGGVRSA